MPDMKEAKKQCITKLKELAKEHAKTALNDEKVKKALEDQLDDCEDELADFAKSYAWAVPVAATLGATTLLAGVAAVACYMRK